MWFRSKELCATANKISLTSGLHLDRPDLSCQDGPENVKHVADSIWLVGDRAYTYPADCRNSSQAVGVARRCHNHSKSVLSILVRKPHIPVDCAGVSRAPSWIRYRHSSLPPLACMVIVRPIFGILRVDSGNSNERVSYDVSFGQCASPEPAMSASV